MTRRKRPEAWVAWRTRDGAFEAYDTESAALDFLQSRVGWRLYHLIERSPAEEAVLRAATRLVKHSRGGHVLEIHLIDLRRAVERMEKGDGK